MIRFVLATAGTLMALPSYAFAQDQLRVLVVNDSGYVVKKIQLLRYAKSDEDYVVVDTNDKNMAVRESRSVKWNAPGDSTSDVFKVYVVPYGVSDGEGEALYCNRKIKVTMTGDQITNVGIGNVKTILGFDSSKDEIVRLRFSARGRAGSPTCGYRSYKLYDR